MKLAFRSVIISSVALILCGCQGKAAQEAKPAAVAETKPVFAQFKAQDKSQIPTYWIVGDSTVKNGSGNRLGWGEVIAPLFDKAKIDVVNKAIGGRSTRNYMAQGRWKEVLDKAKPGDYVTVQFGHNDRGSFRGPKGDRGVLPGIGDETQEVAPDPNKPDEMVTVHTYGWYLRQYVNDAKTHKLNIILVTPVARNNWSKDGTLNNDLRPWAEYVIEVAKQGNVPVLDLNAIIAGQYSEMGKEKVDGILFEGRDQTHTTKAGAEFNAKCVAEGLRKLDGCDLKDYLVAN
jgi:rhamnogalacturonan acetylesterase